MNRFIAIEQVLVWLVVSATGAAAAAGMIYDTGSYGRVGVRWDEAVNFGAPVDATHAVGARFHLDRGADVSSLSSSLVSQGPGFVLASLVRLDGVTDYPDSLDMSSDDVVATTLLRLPPELSDVVTAPVDATLTPGWWAIVLSSGSHGADGSGLAVGAGPELPGQSWLAYDGAGWRNLPKGQNLHLVAEGDFAELPEVPEPGAAVLGLLGVVLVAGVLTATRHRPEASDAETFAIEGQTVKRNGDLWCLPALEDVDRGLLCPTTLVIRVVDGVACDAMTTGQQLADVPEDSQYIVEADDMLLGWGARDCDHSYRLAGCLVSGPVLERVAELSGLELPAA